MSNIDPNMAPDTILYVDACVEKWQPFIKDVDKARQGRLAYLCERETIHWKAELGDDPSPITQSRFGAQLKFIYPTLKKLDARLLKGVTGFEQIAASADEAWEDMFPFPENQYGCVRRDRPSNKEKRGFLSPLVERAHASLLVYKKIVGKRFPPPVMG